MKTAEEIQKLKDSWHYDPIWDIYETEGFEEHYEELKAYQESVENDRKEKRIKKIQEKSEELGIKGNLELTEYITRLEGKINWLSERISSIQGQLYSGR